MLVLCAMRSRHEATGDERIIPLMTRYLRYRSNLSDREMFPGRWGNGEYNLRWWQHVRAVDEIESIYWLYNRTGEDWLLSLAERMYRLSANWNDNVASWHGVNICQGFRAPGVFFQQTGDTSLIAGSMATLKQVFDLYGQVPGGMFGADENCRKAYAGPRQAAELCSMVELMNSYESLLKITGNAELADRCEDIAFNSLPASMTADLKALHYLTSPNMIQLDRHTKSPGVQNGGCMLAFSPHRYRCCQHNAAMGWPYYSEHLWMATPDGGLAAVFYAESEVRARVRGGIEVAINATTDYPFDETVRLQMSTSEAVRFPLLLRVPGWCRNAEVRVNGELQPVSLEPSTFAKIERTWADGDRIELRMPMEVKLRTWRTQRDSVSVSRGPLTYSLRIEENYVAYDDEKRRQPFANAEKWQAHEVYPATPWNYGLVLSPEGAASSFEVVKRPGPLPSQPFDAENVPIVLKAKGMRIADWQPDHRNLVGELQPSPARVDEIKPENITLVPMGCARLRISSFPTVGTGPSSHVWKAPRAIPHTASHEHDDLAALSDGRWPNGSADPSIPRFTLWPRLGTTEWVTYELEERRTVSEVNLYWFDDTGRGKCRVPRDWRVLYRNGTKWLPVQQASPAAAARDRYNRMTFAPVETAALKLEIDLQQGYSGGILEWVIGPPGPS